MRVCVLCACEGGAKSPNEHGERNRLDSRGPIVEDGAKSPNAYMVRGIGSIREVRLLRADPQPVWSPVGVLSG